MPRGGRRCFRKIFNYLADTLHHLDPPRILAFETCHRLPRRWKCLETRKRSILPVAFAQNDRHHYRLTCFLASESALDFDVPAVIRIQEIRAHEKQDYGRLI
jgi:hypothetical protein